MERCNSCIMPKTHHSVRFDGDTCSLCAAHTGKVMVRSPSNDVDCHIERIRKAGEGLAFDCLVGISGGRDSTYLLHQLVRRHGLRCLAAYHRTPFTPDIIDANVRRLVERLNVPLVEMDIPMDYHRRIARAVVLLWLKKPLPVIANLACAPCKSHNREILKIAKKHGIKYLVMGSNKYELFQLNSGYHDALADRISFAAKLKQLLMLMKKGGLVLTQSVGIWRFLWVGIRSVLYISPESPFLRCCYGDINTFNYFFHTEWSEAECEKSLSELGWEIPPNCNSSWRADCVFAEVKNYMFGKMNGISYVDALFSNLIRAGILSRDEALKRVDTEGKFSRDRFAEACRIMNLHTDIFN